MHGAAQTLESQRMVTSTQALHTLWFFQYIYC